MLKEINPARKTGLMARSVAAGAIALLPAYDNLNTVPSEPVTIYRDNEIKKGDELIIVNEDQLEPSQFQEISRNEQISNFLEDNKIRSLIAAAFLASLASSYLTYRLGQKHDDEKLRKLRVTAPLLMLAAIGSLGTDSFTTIDRHIPAALLAGSIFIQAGYNLFNTYQRETRKDIRRGALATSTGLVSIGLTLLYVSDKI